MIIRFERRWERYAYYALVAVVAGMCILCGFAVADSLNHPDPVSEQSK